MSADQSFAEEREFLLPFEAALLDAVSAGDAEGVDRLVLGKGSACVRVRDRRGRRAIHYAAIHGSARIIRTLVRAGSPVNLLDEEGKAPLHLAVEAGHEGAVEALMGQGAHVNSCSTVPEGATALHLAARLGHSNLLAIMIRHGGNVNVLSKVVATAHTPLHQAARSGQSAGVEVLCQMGANPSMRDMHQGRQPLHFAAELGDLASVRCLLQHGAPLNDADAQLRTPLMLAVKEKHVEVVRELLQRGADTTWFNAASLNVVHSAIISRSTECLLCLLEVGADINVRARDTGESPLMMSLGLGLRDTSLLLLRHGADVNLPDNKNYTALHRCPIIPCGESIRCELLQALLEAGADLSARDHQGHTPLQRCLVSDVLRREDGMGCVKLLVEAGSRLGPDTYAHNRRSPLLWLVFAGWLQKAAYLVNTGWDLTFETWVGLPGRTAEQTAVHQALGHHAATPCTLRSLCRLSVRAALWEHSGHREILSLISRLPVPAVVQRYLMFRDRDYAEWAPDLLCPDFLVGPNAPTDFPPRLSL